MNNPELIQEIVNTIKKDKNPIDLIEQIKEVLHNVSPLNEQPVNIVKWVDIEKVSPNDYNPNSVAKIEMGLLYTSIKHDGYTQPIVTIYDEEKDKYIIVDGFHRYFTCLTNEDIKQRNFGRVPIVVIQKDINDRMASTVRHNRARGKHSITGMSNMVFEMLQNGWKDEEICNELGMQPEEVLKLKHITGFSKLFQNVDYKKAWEETRQLKLRKQYQMEQNKTITE
jgi:ParB-like chromosome segregation protein Spo0J